MTRLNKIILSALLVILLSPQGFVFASSEMDFYKPSVTVSYGTWNGTVSFTFTPTASYNLDSVTIKIQAHPSHTHSSNWTLLLETTAAGLPSDTVMETSGVYDPTSLGTSLTDITFNFAGTTLLNSGTKYAFVLNMSSPDWVGLGEETTGGYSGGDATYYDSGAWHINDSADAWFDIFGTVGGGGGEEGGGSDTQNATSSYYHIFYENLTKPNSSSSVIADPLAYIIAFAFCVLIFFISFYVTLKS